MQSPKQEHYDYHADKKINMLIRHMKLNFNQKFERASSWMLIRNATIQDTSNLPLNQYQVQFILQNESPTEILLEYWEAKEIQNKHKLGIDSQFN